MAPQRHLGDELGVTTLEMVVRGNRHGDERTEHETRENRVQIRGHGLRIECRGKEVRDDRLATMRRLDDLVTRGRLHPRIGDENPQRRKHRAEPHEPAGNHVELGRHAFTAKEEHTQEARLQKEGEQCLGGKRRAEDVAHEARVIGPVGAEAKLHGDARRNADRKGEREDLDPETGVSLVLGVTRLVGARLGERDEQAQTNGQRYEQEVEYDSQRELKARQKDHIAKQFHVSSFRNSGQQRRCPSPLTGFFILLLLVFVGTEKIRYTLALRIGAGSTWWV